MTPHTISHITKIDREYSDFVITTQNGSFIVTLDGEWVGTFQTEYLAKLHTACISR